MATTHQPAVSANGTSALPTAPLDIFVAGVGAVGQDLLRQLSALPSPAPLRLIGACTSARTYWDDAGVRAQQVLERASPTGTTDWPALLARLTTYEPRLVFVDATGSPVVAAFYQRLLEAGVHVVTPSKLANTQEHARYAALHEAARAHDVQYRYETTVGAGLPVVGVVQDLVATGDRIRSIRGAVSGTLTFLFTQLEAGQAFSEAVRTAREKGYAEPDVRDDLSGEDVARKFMILARTAGATVERDAVQVETLVPEALREIPTGEVLDRLHTYDDTWRARVEEAQQAGQVLRYAGRWDEDGIRVGITSVPTDAPLGGLRGTDNLIEIWTDRYSVSPIIVRGPGAGPAVTAAGVLADVLKVAATTRG